MPDIEQAVENLVTEDDEMESAIETVLEAADGGAVKWVEVRNDITSGQWGRLIETGVLVDGDSGFAVADRDAVESGLEADTEVDLDLDVDDDTPDDSSWSVYDKVMAVVAVSMFPAYGWEPARNLVGGTADLVLGPLDATLPFYVVVMVIATATGLYSTLMRALLMDMEKMGAYRERMQAIQEKRKEAKERGDDEALDEIQEKQMEAMGDQLGMFKEQFRPMVWIMALIIPAFLWMYWKLGIRGGAQHGTFEPLVFPLIGEAAWTASVIGPLQAWILWYFVCTMSFTQIIQKSLNISMSPT